MAYWIYKKVLLLLAAYVGILSSVTMIPNPSPWSISSFIGEILFSPLKLLIAVFLFVVGFLSYSLFVRDLVKVYRPRIHDYTLRIPRLFFVLLAILSWLHLLSQGGMLALIGLALALWYGIMDVNLEKRNR
ncbi:hypothetical protein [Halalkalibacter alkalisediminis]|uniref:Uncharacterized protein n=1 Tax=Halalkalibacter alkalisediminis TaxID=935616 RepID=A0ABV6NGE8_9BACI|nr:hypothetical protein [Halalkalibacter alkalisediminis]